MWGGIGVTQPPRSSPRLGGLRLTKASVRCSSCIYVDALSLLSIDVVIDVSDASPLCKTISQYTYSTPLTILPSESRTLSALGSGSTKVRQTDARSTVFRGGSGSVWIYGFWRGWSINLEKGARGFYWYCIPNRAAGSVLGLLSV